MTLRAAATQAVRRMDHAIGRLSKRLRVLVDVRTPMNLAVLRPVWRRLEADSRLALAFTAEDMGGVREALDADGLRECLVPREAAAWMRLDLAMTADAWNHAPLHRCRRRINFFHGVAGKYDLDDPQKLQGAAFDRFDRLAFINPDRMRRYIETGAIRRDQAVLVGFPKTDDLVNGVWTPASVRESLGLSPSLRTILYAPTFSTANSLHLAGEAIIETLLATGANVIVKLHDRSMVPTDKHTNGIDWPARLARFESHPRFAFARMADSGPCLSAADVLVTDHSTVGFEFALLDRPLVVFDAPDLKHAARIDSEKWMRLRSMSDVVTSTAQLSIAVNRAFAEPERWRDERRSAHDLFAFVGAATNRALDVVYELLELTPLAVDTKVMLLCP
jgi:CDP-glycerol glycerophosphotransferase (TagB/SpsB family)